MEENKKKIVVDASVLVKWALRGEKFFEEAMSLREGIRKGELKVFVPGHCFSELCNVLCRKAPGKTLTFLSDLRKMGFVEFALSVELAGLAFDLTQKHPKISFYDAFYHAIALAQGCLFVTADERYYRMTKKEGNVVLLKDFVV